MSRVRIQDANGQLSELLGLVEAGEEVVIERSGRPMAKLVRIAPAAPDRIPGTWEGAIEIADDFDAPMPDEWLQPLDP